MSARSCFRTAAALLLTVLLLASCAGKKAPAPAPAAAGPDPARLRAMAVEAYLYGYPLVTMEFARRIQTNVAEPAAFAAPMNRFAHERAFAAPGSRETVRPSADALASTAWVDLSAGPVVLSLPDARGRYVVMQVLSAWTEVLAAPGSRVSGTQAQNWVLTGPGWKGSLPPGMREIRSPTNLVCILGRTACTGTAEDYAAVHALQDQYALKPLAAWGRPSTAPAGAVDPRVDMQTPVRDQVEALPGVEFFRLLLWFMRDNPGLPQDAAMLEQMAELGLVPGRDLNLAKLPLAVAGALAAAPRLGLERIAARSASAAYLVDGWSVELGLGTFGTDYESRAYAVAMAPGSGLPQDAAQALATGWYSGENHYVLRFPAGGLPPVNAFWSVTLYDSEGFFAANPLQRFALGSRSALRPDADGSVPLYIQHDSPGPDKEANWLPAPNGVFSLALRLYWPKATPPSILDHSWIPPEIELAK